MSLLKKMDSVMSKIFQIMNKINKFSNQMAELTPSPDYGKEKTKRKEKTTKENRCRARNFRQFRLQAHRR